MVQIDIIRLLELLIEGNSVTHKNGKTERGDLAMRIIHALKDMGYDFKDGHIISITEQNADFKIEKGKWYMCIKSNENFTCGKVYKAVKDFRITDDNGKTLYFSIIGISYREYFRPATEEEIRGNTPVISPNSPAPQIDNFNEIKQAEPKQENFQDFKELERNGKNDELTGFEKYISRLLGHIVENPNKYAKLTIRGHAEKLLSIARKQIASEIDVNAMADEYAAKNYHLSSNFALPLYRQGIEDVLKNIKEG